MDGGWEFWQGYDQHMISLCDEVHVLMLQGWTNSVGVTAEIKIAKRLNKPFYYIDPRKYVKSTIP